MEPLSPFPYPPMSHPVADPARNVVAARFSGLHVPNPATARILEIGCATGHHLLPLAMRWPNAEFVGIDQSAASIASAKELANEAGLGDRISFHAISLEEYDPPAKSFDFIIAHGFFSWVNDQVKLRLLNFCASHLTKNGVAVISFNVEAGWRMRETVIRKVRALESAALADGFWDALHILRAASENPDQSAIIEDMLAKGPAVLTHDDFAPVNDPWRLARFVTTAQQHGLRWLGESELSNNQPNPWSPADEEARRHQQAELSPLELHQWMDEHSHRTFRSALLCRLDAPVTGKLHLPDLASLSIRPTYLSPKTSDPMLSRIHDTAMSRWPSTITGREIIDTLSDLDATQVSKGMAHGMVTGEWFALSEGRIISPTPPAYPQLNPLRMSCARRKIPVVDAWHSPCVFSDNQWPLLTAMDGKNSLEQLKNMASEQTPRLDFSSWMAELHHRGMFEGTAL